MVVTNWKRILQRILIVVVTCLLAYFIPNFNMVVSFNILIVHRYCSLNAYLDASPSRLFHSFFLLSST